MFTCYSLLFPEVRVKGWARVAVHSTRDEVFDVYLLLSLVSRS